MGSILAPFWLHLGRFGLPFGSIWLPLGSILVALGSNLAPKSTLLAPSLLKNRFLGYPTLQITTKLPFITPLYGPIFCYFSEVFEHLNQMKSTFLGPGRVCCRRQLKIEKFGPQSRLRLDFGWIFRRTPPGAWRVLDLSK